MRKIWPAAVFLLILAAACSPTLSTPTPGVPTLDQSYTSTAGTLTFDYPAGWSVRESEGQIFVGTSEQALADTSGDATATPGQFAFGIIVFPITDVVGVSPDAGPREMLDVFAEFIGAASQTAGDPVAPSFGDATELTIGGSRAARAEGTSGSDQALLIALELETGVFAILAGGSAAGELARYEPTLLAIADSMRYTAPTEPGN